MRKTCLTAENAEKNWGATPREEDALACNPSARGGCHSEKEEGIRRFWLLLPWREKVGMRGDSLNHNIHIE